MRGLICVDPNAIYFFERHPEAVEEAEDVGVLYGTDLAPSQ